MPLIDQQKTMATTNKQTPTHTLNTANGNATRSGTLPAPFSTNTTSSATNLGSLRSSVTKAPLPQTELNTSNPRRLPRRTSSLSRQRSLTEIAAETAATVIGSEQAAALNTSGSQAVEYLSGKISNAFSYLTSTVPVTPLVKQQAGDSANNHSTISSSNPNLATTEIVSTMPFHKPLTKMSSNRISAPEKQSQPEREFLGESGEIGAKTQSLMEQCKFSLVSSIDSNDVEVMLPQESTTNVSPRASGNQQKKVSSLEQSFSNGVTKQKQPKNSSTAENHSMRPPNNNTFEQHSVTTSTNNNTNTHSAQSKSKKSSPTVAITNTYSTVTNSSTSNGSTIPSSASAVTSVKSSGDLRAENEQLKVEVDRQRSKIYGLESALAEMQKKNAKMEEMILALQRSTTAMAMTPALHANSVSPVDNNSEQSLPISTPSNEANEEQPTFYSEFPNKATPPLSVNVNANISTSSKQPQKISPNGNVGGFHQKSYSDVQFYNPPVSANQMLPLAQQPQLQSIDNEENYEAISHEYSSIAHFTDGAAGTGNEDDLGKVSIMSHVPTTPEPIERPPFRFSNSKITRTGSYSEKRHFTISSTNSPLGTSLDCEENQYNSVPDLLDKNLQSSFADSLHSTSITPMSRSESKATGRNVIKMANSSRHHAGGGGGIVGDGFSSDVNPNLSDNSPIEFTDSPRPELFARGGTSRSTAGPRMMLNQLAGNKFSSPSNSSASPDVPFKTWDAEQIAFWMANLGLGKYVSYVNSHQVNGEKLSRMTPNEIEKNLRVKNSLHRKKLLLAIRAQLVGNWSDFGAMTTQWVARWLDDIGLPQYKDAFIDASVDGRVLHYLTFDDFALVKIFSAVHQISIGRAIQYLRIQGWKPDTFIRRSNNFADDSSLLHWSNHRVMEWLRSIDLSEYAPNLRGSGVHGALMCLEPRFTADTLADLLHIPVSKTLLRRHLIHHFDALIGPMCKEHKRLIESSPYYQPLNIHYKVKPAKSRFKIPKPVAGRSQSKAAVTVGSVDDLVCPLEFEVPSHIPSEVLPLGYIITSKDFSRSSPHMIEQPAVIDAQKVQQGFV